MGKNIVRRSHPDNPRKHSRLWIHEEIKEILANDLGTKKTRYICPGIVILGPEIVQGLKKMKELRFLHLYWGFHDASESQDWKFNELPNALQYLFWLRYPFRSLPATFQADNLVSLKMPYSSIVQLWEGGERKVLNKLRFLDLNGSKLRTCDLRSAPNLEKLDLESCETLIELLLPHTCLNLRSLKLNDSKLRTLDIGLSPNIEYLNLRNCDDLEEFHMADGCLKKLVYLDLSGTLRFKSFKFLIKNGASRSADESLEGGPLAELYLIAEPVDECDFHPDSNLPKFQFKCRYEEGRPLLSRNLEMLISVGLCACTTLDTFSRSICGLQHLRKLKLQGSILEAPEDLDQLEFLQQLDFCCPKITHLPNNICVLKHLKSIRLSKCTLLEKLPQDLGQLECLEELDFSYTNIKVLPGSICKLKHLESLSLNGCSLLEKLPEDLGRLECLGHLNLCGCIRVEKLPEEIGRLGCLESLFLKNTGISHLPQSIFLLKGLLIYGSEELLQSCGFTSEIQCLYGNSYNVTV